MPTTAYEVPAPFRTFRLLAVQRRRVSVLVISSGVVEVCGGVSVSVGLGVSVWGGVSAGGFVVLSVGVVVVTVVPVWGEFGTVSVGCALQPVKVRASAKHKNIVISLFFICFLRGFACCSSIVASRIRFVNTRKGVKGEKNFSKGEQRGFTRARILTEKVFYYLERIVYDIISMYNIILYSRSKLCLMNYWTEVCT